jgi:hypothetical protein
MQRGLHSAAALLLAALLAQATAGMAQTQQPTGPQLVEARQEIQAELAAAIADGNLTPMKQYKILLHAKEKLPLEDVEGLERTMVRLSAANRSGHAMATAPTVSLLATRSDVGGDVPPAEGTLQYDAPGGASMSDQPGGFVPVESADEVVMQTFGDNIRFANCEAGLLGGDGSYRENMESVWEQVWHNASFFTGVDAFKGPTDLFVPNGNFGVDFGVNLGIPLSRQLGIGVQAGASAVMSDFQGTVQADDFSTPTSEIRQQTFFTLGLFQRIPLHDVVFCWGFAHDWLYDDYYSQLDFAQWRVKLGVQWNPCNEIGLWAAMPDHGATTTISESSGGPTADIHYRSLAQGNLYWQHIWSNAATTTTWVGISQEPGNFIFGADARLPITQRMSLIGNFTYIMPRGNGIDGQADELWNVCLGIEFVPGGSNHCPPYRFSPLMPVADNGSLAVRVLP